MTEKIKEIVDQFFQDHSSWGTYKYRLDSSYWVKFQFTLRTDQIRVYLYSELPGYEFSRSAVYKMSYGPLNDDNEGLAALILMIYREIEKMNKDGISISYDLYKSVLSDNEKLREQIKSLEQEIETWKKASVENHGAYQSAMKYASDWKDKYIKEKMDHTTTKARIIFAKHILDGNRDERVLEHMEKNEF
jgi:hypothetical protein